MKNQEQLLRSATLYALSPGLLMLIAVVVVMRPFTAMEDHFHGPDEMWHDLREWARTGRREFPSWHRAARGHLRHANASKATVSRAR